MMLKLRIKFIALFLLAAVNLQAQTSQYRYKRDLKDVNSKWHSLKLPNEIFKNTQIGLADLRIFGFKGKDTIEVPYILDQSVDQINDKETAFNIINQSKNNSGFFYTFQASAAANINQINLSFKQENFDWKITLDGSNDNKEWFTILTDYRVLSIKNNNTNYQFTQLNFPTAKYIYFRITLKANEQPILIAAKILKTDTLKGVYKDVQYKSYQLFNDVKNKQSIINVDLENPTPIANLKINLKSDFDFYRALKIEFATDSFKTEKGIRYNYSTLYEGTISSLENTEFSFGTTLATHLRLTIDNKDNPPLRITSVKLKGPIYEIIGRFDDPNLIYSLFYGNKRVDFPSYELKNFENKIPMQVSDLSVGSEQINTAFTTAKVEKPLFENKLWLWCIMGVIISILGFFAFKMLKS